MHAVLIKYHVMLACDGHTDLMPIPAPPLVTPNPRHPHIVGHILWGWTLGTVTTKTNALGIDIIARGSDIANGIPHIPVPPTHFILAVLYTAFSGSKSHFGPSSVKAEGKPVGAALLVIVNTNLNCWDVVPLPFGWVCAPNTVMVGMTLGDILGGLFSMAMDMAVQAFLNYCGGKVAEDFTSQVGKLLSGPLAAFWWGSPLGKSALDIFKAAIPDSWVTDTTLDNLSWIPGFPGYGGTYASGLSDVARAGGELLGDGHQSVFGNQGAAAADSAPATANQPVPTSSTSTPMDGVTNNPSVEGL